jgi:hypothetical protein
VGSFGSALLCEFFAGWQQGDVVWLCRYLLTFQSNEKEWQTLAIIDNSLANRWKIKIVDNSDYLIKTVKNTNQ